MAQNSCTTVPVIKKLVQEQVNCSTKGIDSEVSNILQKSEQSKRDTERQVRKGGLNHTREVWASSAPLSAGAGQGLTSSAMPGTNIATANPWKNFRRALSPSVGICLSAASRRSVATFETFDPFGKVGIEILDRFGNVSPVAEDGLGPADWLLLPETSALSDDALLSYAEERASSPPGWLRRRNRRVLESCLPQPATLMHPRRVQYNRSNGRLHFFFPSTM